MAEEVLIIGPYELKGKDLEEFLKFREEHIKSVKCYIDYEQGLPCFHEMVWLMKRFKERRCVKMIGAINTILRRLYEEEEWISVRRVDSGSNVIEAEYQGVNIRIELGEPYIKTEFRIKNSLCNITITFCWKEDSEKYAQDIGDLAKDVIKIAEILLDAHSDLVEKLEEEGYIDTEVD